MLLYDHISTPIGTVLAGATSEGICILEFTDTQDFKHRIAKVEQYLTMKAVKGKNIHLLRLNESLNQYFNHQLTEFDIPLKFIGTDFQVAIWKALLFIPCGRTYTYANFSDILDRPRAIRAIAAAIGQNHLSILVPCHRVVGSDNKLVGYSGGLWRKHWLLKHETGRSTGTGEIPFSYDDLASIPFSYHSLPKAPTISFAAPNQSKY
ncbi:MAG: methylated-DNA--[protein]-cysteine S-methyltransferase [Bacteroidales bacterium]|nr:methylated-DNA--[protein]-cysteine S-methyltransferase [Bacteroidales bacterium]MDZ4203352.1 methylated-DNA--[protein]-cysteine S-methyltransferase [Bacteroidales bacterium]